MADDISKKKDTNSRLSRLEQAVADLRSEATEVKNGVTDLKEEVQKGFRDIDLRLSTEVHEVTSLIRDLKSWLVERDDTKQRLAKLEEQVKALTPPPATPPSS